MLEKRVCDQKESEYEQKKDGVLERKYNDGRSGDMGRRKNTEMKYVETLKKTVLIFGCALFVNILFWSSQRMLLQRGIAEEVLRFHVLANSDSAADQAVKLEVRDAVLAWLEEAQIERSVTQGKKETANTGTENDSSFMSGLESEKNTKEKEEEFLRAHLTMSLHQKVSPIRRTLNLLPAIFLSARTAHVPFRPAGMRPFVLSLAKQKDTTGGVSFIPVCVLQTAFMQL